MSSRKVPVSWVYSLALQSGSLCCPLVVGSWVEGSNLFSDSSLRLLTYNKSNAISLGQQVKQNWVFFQLLSLKLISTMNNNLSEKIDNPNPLEVTH
ncbi:hypothetical protein E1A91_A13G185200v1 [Gossypium mustelinum]|uniref:Uncharacterized protein n=1 Tax=Gossypium mustelinum TaxID=34275 RepID=A0A5D2WJP4_GOSMU|nr:hypothetical protein E1A91_A13G185200v1 [Gossypium mustelinum]